MKNVAPHSDTNFKCEIDQWTQNLYDYLETKQRRTQSTRTPSNQEGEWKIQEQIPLIIWLSLIEASALQQLPRGFNTPHY
jgi:hypothetical protein